MSTQTEKLTPTGEAIQDLINGRNEITKLIKDGILTDKAQKAYDDWVNCRYTP